MTYDGVKDEGLRMKAEIDKLCKEYLEKVRADPQHHLSYEDRFELYLSFGPSRLHLPSYDKTGEQFNHSDFMAWEEARFNNLTTADYAVCWLNILVAKKVLPICKRDSQITRIDTDGSSYPPRTQWYFEAREAIKAAERCLNKRITLAEASEILHTYAYYFMSDITYVVEQAWNAAMVSLENVLAGSLPSRDSAGAAVKAYTFYDWTVEVETVLEDPPDISEYDPNKRLKFWEWWLTEAIPKALDIAEKYPLEVVKHL